MSNQTPKEGEKVTMEASEFSFHEIPAACNIVFFDNLNSLEVGRFEWDANGMRFTGNADKSARIFIDSVIKQFNAGIPASLPPILLSEVEGVCKTGHHSVQIIMNDVDVMTAYVESANAVLYAAGKGPTK